MNDPEITKIAKAAVQEANVRYDLGLDAEERSGIESIIKSVIARARPLIEAEHTGRMLAQERAEASSTATCSEDKCEKCGSPLGWFEPRICDNCQKSSDASPAITELVRDDLSSRPTAANPAAAECKVCRQPLTQFDEGTVCQRCEVSDNDNTSPATASECDVIIPKAVNDLWFCPFCGFREPCFTHVTPEISKAWGYTARNANWCAACPKCGVSTPFKTSKQEAAECWNTRFSCKLDASPATTSEKDKCRKCGRPLGWFEPLLCDNCRERTE